MATPNSSDEKSPNPGLGAEIAQSTNADQENAREEPVKKSSTSVFVNSEPMREEQVQNAVKFLSHPKVRGSPVIYRRSFLEKKGLTKEEIDEAFRRVPDSPPNMQTADGNQDGQLKPTSIIQQQAPAQNLQQGAPASTGTPTSLITLSRSRFHWSHAFIAIGLLAASSAGTALLIKRSILPWLKSWIRKVVIEEDDPLIKADTKPSLAEETAQAAKAAAAAAADMAKVSQDMLISHNEERKQFGVLLSLVDKQVQEMKLMTNAIRRLEASSGATFPEKKMDSQVTRASSKQLIANGKVDYDLHSGGYSSTPTSAEPSTAPHPKSYMEIMAMIQRGEKPSNIRDINDSPPNPNQQPSNPRLAPRTKPWEVNQVQNTSAQVLQSQENGQYMSSNFQESTIEVKDDPPAPWWQRKNVRIRDIDHENEHDAAAHYSAPSSQQPLKRTWVPPQPPPIAMPEAAEAIRHSKPMVQNEAVPNEQSAAHSPDISDEFPKIPKISESEGVTDSLSSIMPSTGEIQEVH